MREDARALARLQIRVWARSRGPLLWSLFLLAWGWFNWEALGGRDGSPWWAGWAALAAWIGFLAGYDAYARMREDGTIRLLLLQPASRWTVAVGTWAGGTALTVIGLLLFLAFVALLYTPPPDSHMALAALLVLLTGGAFVAYAQLASLLMPRDSAAVLGLIVVVGGATAHDRWIPPGAPEWVEPATYVLFLLLPTTYRLTTGLAGDGVIAAAVIPVAQTTLAVTAIGVLLRRRALTRRRDR